MGNVELVIEKIPIPRQSLSEKVSRGGLPDDFRDSKQSSDTGRDLSNELNLLTYAILTTVFCIMCASTDTIACGQSN
jgi:hypothetical protein